MKRLVTFVFFCIATSLLAACGSGGTPPLQPRSTDNEIQSRDIVESGIVEHVLPARGVRVLSDGTSASGRAIESVSVENLLWKGGPVQHSPRVYLVFWGPWSTSDPEYTRLVALFKGLSGSQWSSTLTQYRDATGAISNTAYLAGAWIDNSAVPSVPTISNVASEAQRASAHFGYIGVNANFLVAIAKGHYPSGFPISFCSSHASMSGKSGTLAFTEFPYIPAGGSHCGAGKATSPGTYDGVTIAAAHEEAEVESDPEPSLSWRDAYGREVADKCAWTNTQNTRFSTGSFPTQPLWSNKAEACLQ